MRLLVWGGVAGILLVSAVQGRAQQAQPTLQQVLTTVQRNYAEYLKTLPNLYAHESMASDVKFYDLGKISGGQHITYDSDYRLRRVASAKDERAMEETRQIVAVDHKPVGREQKLEPPYLVINPESAPNVFWPGWGRCFDYKLGASRKWQGKTVWVLEYATGKDIGPTDKCPIEEPVEGRALIDPETMTMVRFEQMRPKHSPGMSTIRNLRLSPEVKGTWRWSIDYAPVTLKDKSFNLPKTITSTFELRQVLWSSVSSYSKYQLADVQTKMLLPDGTEMK